MRRISPFCVVVALSFGCLPWSLARAQENGAQTADLASPQGWFGDFTIGTQWLGGTNTNLYGRYNGFTTQGLDVLMGFRLEKRDPWDSGGALYYNVTGINLNFQTGDRLARGFKDSAFKARTHNNLGPAAEIGVEFGKQGTWEITADYNAISYAGNIIKSIYAVDGSIAALNNSMAAWGGATNNPLQAGPVTSFTTQTLSPSERAFQVGTRRDILQFLGRYFFHDWTLATKVRHEHKEGTLEESLRATYGGMAFTMPVDYDTDIFDVSLAYSVPGFQSLLQYTYSHFADQNLAFTFPYPVSIASLSANSGPFAQSALYSAPPSNSAHYVTAMVADNIRPKTRIALNGRAGVELQDSTFPANSADPFLSSTLGNPTYTWFRNLNAMNQGTSAFSPQATAWVYQGNLAVTSNLATDLDGRLSYALDGRSVHLNQYEVWIGGPSPDATANTAVYVVPQDWFKQTAKAELDYRLRPESNTKVTASYSFNDTKRSNAQVQHSMTNTVSLQLSSTLGSDILGRITYEHGERNGTLIYGRAWGNLETGAPEVFGTPSGAYYQAPMTSDAVIARTDYAPSGNVSGGLFLKYADHRYRYPEIPVTAPAGNWTLVGHGQGIKRDYNLTVGPDVSYRLNSNVNLHFYYTYELIFFDNRGNGACAESNTGNCAGSAGYFQNTYTSHMNTAGVRGEWQASPKLKLSGDYNMSSGSVLFGQFNGVFVSNVSQSYQNVVSYPDIHSAMHDVRLTAAYQIEPNIEWSLIYGFSMFHNNDWNNLTAPVQPSTNSGTAIGILTPGYPSPNYNVTLVGTIVKVRL